MDVYDINQRPTGRQKARDDQFAPGEYRLNAFAVLRNAKGELLITLRDPGKPAYPNTWGHTGGGVRAGETSREAIAREVREETGIAAEPDAFCFLCTRMIPEWSCFTDLYLLQCDVPIEALTLQPGETVDAKWVSVADFERMIAQGEIAAPDANRWERLKALIAAAPV